MHSILAVDDSASMRQMVSFTLKNAGFNVVEAVDGQDAYDCLLYTSPSPRDRTRSRMPSSA